MFLHSLKTLQWAPTVLKTHLARQLCDAALRPQARSAPFALRTAQFHHGGSHLAAGTCPTPSHPWSPGWAYTCLSLGSHQAVPSPGPHSNALAQARLPHTQSQPPSATLANLLTTPWCPLNLPPHQKKFSGIKTLITLFTILSPTLHTNRAISAILV